MSLEDRARLVQRLVQQHRRQRDASSSGSCSDASINFASDFLGAADTSAVHTEQSDELNRTQNQEYFDEQREHSFARKVAKNYDSVRRNAWCERAPRAGDRRGADARDAARAAQEAEIARQCTFSPALPLRSTRIAERQRERESLSLTDRLHAEASVRAEERGLLAMKIEQLESEGLTFVPDLSSSSRTGGSDDRPLHERVGDLQRERGRRTMELKARLESDIAVELTFSPAIDARSRRLAEGRGGGQVGERLQQEGRLAAYKKQLAEEEARKSALASFTAPKPSAGSDRLAEASPLLRASFFDRVGMFELRAKLAEDRRKLDQVAETTDWFRPKIHSSTVAIVSKRMPELLEESPEERAFRMSTVARADREQARRVADREVYGALTFSPHMCAASRALGRPSSVEELSLNYRGERRRAQARAQAEEREAMLCPFRPLLVARERSPARGLGLAPSESPSFVDCGLSLLDRREERGPVSMAGSPEELMQRIRVQRAQTDAHRDREKALQQMRELEECTFHPRVRAPPRPSDAPVVIRGLDRFMQLKDLAARLGEDRARREKESFEVRNLENWRRPEDNSTIVKVTNSICAEVPLNFCLCGRSRSVFTRARTGPAQPWGSSSWRQTTISGSAPRSTKRQSFNPHRVRAV